MSYISDSRHAAAVNNLRIPSAMTLAILLNAALFMTLWSLTHVEFDLQPVTAFVFDYNSKPYDPTLVTKRVETPEIAPPPVTPNIPRNTISDAGREITISKAIPPANTPGPEFTKLTGIDNSDVLPLVRVNPDYPIAALNRGMEGWVQVRFTVAATGAVKDAIVVKSSSKVFENNALKAIARWRYNPKVENGVGVERVGMETLIRFTLEK